MTIAWKNLTRQALRGALQVRRLNQVSKYDPICIFDFAQRLGVDVWFEGGSSFSGMFSKTTNTIVVPALRPCGYQSFTCAHELGHWHFHHGSRVDELGAFDLVSNSDPEEILANRFAGYLLMPSWAVERAFQRRQWNPSTCTALQAYIIGTQLGVGYRAIVQHLCWSLRQITETQAKRLLKSSPKEIRESLLGTTSARHLVIADEAWEKVAIDLQVGDVAIVPRTAAAAGGCENIEIAGAHELGVIIVGVRPGISRIETGEGNWASFVRVSRNKYKGPGEYRHWEDPDVDEHAADHQQLESLTCMGRTLPDDAGF